MKKTAGFEFGDVPVGPGAWRKGQRPLFRAKMPRKSIVMASGTVTTPGIPRVAAAECHEVLGGPLGLETSGDGLPVLVGESHDPDLAIVLPSQVVVPSLSPGDE